MDVEALHQQFVDAMVELGHIKSEHNNLSSEMVRAARAQDSEDFVRLSMDEWTLPSRVADLVERVTDLRVELAKKRLEAAENGIEQAKRTVETSSQGLTAVSDRALIKEARQARVEAERKLSELGKERNKARKSLAIGEAVKAEVGRRIGLLKDLAVNGRPPYGAAYFVAWYQLGDAPPNDNQKTRDTEWWGAVENAQATALSSRDPSWWFQ